MIAIRIAGIKAALRDRGWECDDAALRASLESLREQLSISGADPDPDLTIARDAIARLGGEIVQHSPPQANEGEVY